MEVHLAPVLAGFEISCDTAGYRGWSALSNGDLVSVAVGAGFRRLLTRDQLFGESASRALKRFPRFAVVVVNVPERPWPQYREQFLALWREQPIEPVAIGHNSAPVMRRSGTRRQDSSGKPACWQKARAAEVEPNSAPGSPSGRT